MLKAKIYRGPDRFSVIAALGSCYEEQPLTPEFWYRIGEGSAAGIGVKLKLRVSSVVHEGGRPGMYIITGYAAPGTQLPQDHSSYEMFYDANEKTGHVKFFKHNEPRT